MAPHKQIVYERVCGCYRSMASVSGQAWAAGGKHTTIATYDTVAPLCCDCGTPWRPAHEPIRRRPEDMAFPIYPREDLLSRALADANDSNMKLLARVGDTEARLASEIQAHRLSVSVGDTIERELASAKARLQLTVDAATMGDSPIVIDAVRAQQSGDVLAALDAEREAHADTRQQLAQARGGIDLAVGQWQERACKAENRLASLASALKKLLGLAPCDNLYDDQ